MNAKRKRSGRISSSTEEAPELVERLARRTGLSKTAAVEQAVDRIPDRVDATDPLPWDEHGLPA